jgi:hypothetical protein
MNIVNQRPPILHENPQGNIENSIRKAYQAAGSAVKQNPQLILCILQGRSSLYDEIKRIEDTVLGVPTQVKIFFFNYIFITGYLLILFM